jgi:hypothetical protein
MRQVALQISTKTHASVSSHLELVGRAFLRNFITTTLTYRLETPGRSGSRRGSTQRSDGVSIWGLIKIQDDKCSEANSTLTKFCSDPKCVLSEARAFNYSICQGEAMGAYRLQTVGKARTECCLTNQVPRVFSGSLQTICPIARPRLTTLQKHCCGLFTLTPSPS